MFPEIPPTEAYVSLDPLTFLVGMPSELALRAGDTHNDTDTRPLPPPQTLPYSLSRQLDRMINIDVDLLIPVFLLGILPEVRKRRVEEPCADGVCIRYIAPFLLACGKDFFEVWPVCDVCLDVKDGRLVGDERVEIRRSFDVCNDDFGAERVGLLRHG
jgi:hypothetical protein